MNKEDQLDMFDDLIGSLTKMGEPSQTTLKVVDSSNYNLPKMIDDRICAMLLETTLTTDQVALLAALLKSR